VTLRNLAGRGGGHRAPFAGLNRIRFQGFILNPWHEGRSSFATLGWDTPGGTVDYT
jgi:hypothetical protein